MNTDYLPIRLPYHNFGQPLLTCHAKQVGGLPLAELNNLELQFLLLNDFRLSIPVEELEAYGTMLVEFYAREIVAQQTNRSPHSGDEGGDGMYMRSKN